MTARCCVICGADIPVTSRRRDCSGRCATAWSHRPSVRRAIDAAQLKPTPAQIFAALARVGREMAR